MFFHKKWIQLRQNKLGTGEWEMEGWFLFGFLPLYVRDLGLRGRFGKKKRY